MNGTDDKPVAVSAGVLRRDGAVLAGQRRADQEHAGKWEFPGGKIEAGETPEQCLERELGEELGIRATVGALLARRHHSYPGGPTVEVWFFAVDRFEGEVDNRIFAQLRWVTSEKLDDLDWLEADRPLLSTLREPR